MGLFGYEFIFRIRLRDNHYLKTNEIERNSFDQFYGTFLQPSLKIYSQNQRSPS